MINLSLLRWKRNLVLDKRTVSSAQPPQSVEMSSTTSCHLISRSAPLLQKRFLKPWGDNCCILFCQILEIYGMSEISGPQTGNSYDKVPFIVIGNHHTTSLARLRGQYSLFTAKLWTYALLCNVVVQLKPGTIGKDLEGFHSRLDKSAPGAAEVLCIHWIHTLHTHIQTHKTSICTYTIIHDTHEYKNTQTHTTLKT